MIDIQAMFPVMVSSDLEAIKQFYEGVFGFSAVFYDSSFYLHLVSESTGAQLGFLASGHHSQPSFLHPQMVSDGYVISLEVLDAAKAFEQAKDLDLKIVFPLREEPWGQIHFIVEDPAGFRVDLVEQVEVPEA